MVAGRRVGSQSQPALSTFGTHAVRLTGRPRGRQLRLHTKNPDFIGSIPRSDICRWPSGAIVCFCMSERPRTGRAPRVSLMVIEGIQWFLKRAAEYRSFVASGTVNLCFWKSADTSDLSKGGMQYYFPVWSWPGYLCACEKGKAERRPRRFGSCLSSQSYRHPSRCLMAIRCERSLLHILRISIMTGIGLLERKNIAGLLGGCPGSASPLSPTAIIAAAMGFLICTIASTTGAVCSTSSAAGRCIRYIILRVVLPLPRRSGAPVEIIGLRPQLRQSGCPRSSMRTFLAVISRSL